MLYHWRDKYPEYYQSADVRRYKHATLEFKQAILKRCFIDGESVKSVSEEIGYSYSSIYGWARRYHMKGPLALMNPSSAENKTTDIVPAEDIESLKAQLLELQMEVDILKETINVLKKDPGVDQTALKNREKAVIIDALKNKYSLPPLCKKLGLPKSSYYYQEKVFLADDKYQNIRIHICELFDKNRRCFGYRRIYNLLREEGVTISEKVIRRIMRQEGLRVKVRCRRKYNSYKGEISVAVPNLINRDFHADKPNKKWLTDITEFSIKCGKVYLSPIIDCFDGMPVTWTIGTSPNAELVNTMLADAIATLNPSEKPIVHSDRGCHYRWPGWINLMNKSGLVRSMSKKGCSPDNAACEGFFGHLKSEMFYGYNWDDCSVEDFIDQVNDYMNWYREERIQSTLGGMSPMNYRRRMGFAV